MTLAEYQLRMEAYSLQQIKIQERLHLQAFLNQTVQATKGSKKHPKPYYEKFEQFFNVQKMIDEVRSAYEPDYIKQSEVKLTTADVFAKRVAEFKKIKESWEDNSTKGQKGGIRWQLI